MLVVDIKVYKGWCWILYRLINI